MYHTQMYNILYHIMGGHVVYVIVMYKISLYAFVAKQPKYSLCMSHGCNLINTI